MSHHEMPSIGKEMERLEGENPRVILSRLKEERREIDDRDGPDKLSPDERVRFIQLTEQIEELEDRLRPQHFKKAA